MRKRLFTLILALVMALSLLPTAALAIDVTNYPNHKVLSNLPDNPEPTVTASRTDEIAVFTRSLVAGKTTDLEKARAIFDWVSHNIEYDYTAAAYTTASYAGAITEEERAHVREASNADDVFANRRGVCDGYSNLYVSMCRAVGLPVAYISGWDGAPHAWNAVFADGRWIFLDPQYKWDMAPDEYDESTMVLCYSGVFRFETGGRWRVTCDCEDVVIPDGITEIPDNAFNSCPSLTRLTIPDSVTKIGSYVFANGFSTNPNLTHVTIPDSVTEIGKGAFCGCEGLTSITIPASVTSIGEQAFSGCKSLTSITIPASVASIGNMAFHECENLTSVTFLDGATTTVYSGAFLYCHNLTTVTIPVGVTMYASQFVGSYGETFMSDIYYGGTEEQWKTAYVEPPIPWVINAPTPTLKGVTIHYNSPIPKTVAEATGVETVPEAPAKVAYASTQSVLVDGAPVEFQAYALKDQSGNDTNYVKLRDVASVLNGTAATFNVGWDGAVNIETGKGYTPNGSEMNTPFSGNRAYENATAETRINGSRAALDAIVLKDNQGGAYTYYKLRDLGAALGFKVDWTAEKGIFIETK